MLLTRGISNKSLWVEKDGAGAAAPVEGRTSKLPGRMNVEPKIGVN